MSNTRETFLDLIETMDAKEASVGKLYGGEGRSARSQRNSQNPRYQESLTEAARFLARVYSGNLPIHHLKEALGTADFGNLFGDILDRQLLANYRETPYSWQNYAARKTVSDFRTVKRFAVNGAEAVLDTVAEQAEYPESKISDAVYSYAVQKHGRRIPFSWESIINDDLDALKDIPARFGRAARRSEEKFATSLFVDSNGPLAAFFSEVIGNVVDTEHGAATDNPVLSIAALQAAMTVLASQVDSDGEPIAVDAVRLVVPPALAVVAQNIIHATEIWIGDGASQSQSIHTGNWMKGAVSLDVNYYIPVVATTNGATSWFLFADPKVSRPAIELGFLRGHEEPEIFTKDPNAMRAGGGTVNALDGDFDTDSIQYKVRHVFGGVRMDPKAVVASNGSGS